MTAIKDITEHSKRSEKAIEKYLVSEVERREGMAVKYASPALIGMPDRFIMLPDGISFWVELKSKGRNLRPLQRVRRRQLEELGQKVYVADSREDVDEILSDVSLQKALEI